LYIIVIVISLWFLNNCKFCVDIRAAYRVVVGKHEGNRLLGKLRHRREVNIKIDLQKVGRGGTDWIKLAQDRDRWQALVNAIMNLRAP
jgi:CRISPR/Cas system-associated protein Cas7 (RAMP superfamily)